MTYPDKINRTQLIKELLILAISLLTHLVIILGFTIVGKFSTFSIVSISVFSLLFLLGYFQLCLRILTLLFYSETIETNKTLLLIESKKVNKKLILRQYEFDAITDLVLKSRVSPEKKELGFYEDKIQFKYNNKEVEFGHCCNEAEAHQIYKRLQSSLKESQIRK